MKLGRVLLICIFSILILVSIITFSKGESFNPTKEQLKIFKENILVFLKSYYNSDYHKAWEIGKESFLNQPYNYKSKQHFLTTMKNRDNGKVDGFKIFKKYFYEANLVKIDLIENFEFYTVTTAYAVQTKTKEDKILICGRIEMILFRVQNNAFDRFLGIKNKMVGCKIYENIIIGI